jgi:ribonuclease HII
MDVCLKNNCIEAGLDEAGRGPLFGAVYVGCVILDPNETYNSDLIKDSKKLNGRKRLIAFDYVKENALDYSIFSYDEKKIDEINILQATYRGMHEAIKKLKIYPDHLLVDGNYFIPYFNVDKCDYIEHTCIKSGDDKYYNIAAASILAKVSRDKYVEKLCDENENLENNYGIRSNKGYGAARHLQGIKEYGITKWHRKSFGICKNYN